MLVRFLRAHVASAWTGSSRVRPREVTHPVGWLSRATEAGGTTLRLANRGEASLRVLVYIGERQNTPIAWYGPFIGDTRADIARSFERYQAGTFRRI